MTIVPSTVVRRSAAADQPAISRVLAGAFADDPVCAWTIPGAARRRAILPALFALFAAAYQPLGTSDVVEDGGVVGAALWAPPGTHAVTDADAEAFAAAIAHVCGPDSGRMLEAVALLEEQHPAADCYYLDLLGVDPAHHGRGLGSALLSSALRRCDAEGSPAYLDATSPRNRRLYARHGFAVVGEITLPDGPSLWSMWRDPLGWVRDAPVTAASSLRRTS